MEVEGCCLYEPGKDGAYAEDPCDGSHMPSSARAVIAASTASRMIVRVFFIVYFLF